MHSSELGLLLQKEIDGLGIERWRDAPRADDVAAALRNAMVSQKGLGCRRGRSRQCCICEVIPGAPVAQHWLAKVRVDATPGPWRGKNLTGATT